MQLHAALKPLVFCCHLAITNEYLGGLDSLLQQCHLLPNYFCHVCVMAAFTLRIMYFVCIVLDKGSVEVKVEADSNDIAEHAHDDQPVIGMFGFSNF